MSNIRGVRQTTLEKKTTKWKKILKLQNWSISVRYANKKEIDEQNKKIIAAYVSHCDCAAKRASILVNRKYYEIVGYKTAWNVDTLLLHELIHIAIWSQTIRIPDTIAGHKSIENLEEFICDFFGDIIYNIFYHNL